MIYFVVMVIQFLVCLFTHFLQGCFLETEANVFYDCPCASEVIPKDVFKITTT